ncbi:hypothetical protein QTP88_000387 [Uroleucon formosanum]
MASLSGRPQDNVWSSFFKLTPNGVFKTTRARCKKCSKEMSSLVKRMKEHLIKYQLEVEDNTNDNIFFKALKAVKAHTMIPLVINNYIFLFKSMHNLSNDDNLSLNNSTSSTLQLFSNEVCETNKHIASTFTISSFSSSIIKKDTPQTFTNSIGDFVIRTTQIDKKKFDLQTAKFVYGTNTPFRHVEHPEFVFNTTISEIKSQLNGKSVCMSMDGWSNIHNEPVVYISVYDVTEKAVYLVETIDTQDNSHNSEYLLNLAVEAISNCQKYNCTVRSFVTDNAANMAKMREELAQIDEIGAVNNNVCDIITYGCSAHILNLLAHDLEVDSIKSNIKQVIKYFRNSHKIGAKYKQAGGKTLILPSDVRWNTFSDCLQSYLENWHILSSVCSNNRAAIDTTIIRKIEDMEMKRNAEDYFRKLKMISISLDKIKKDSCTLSETIDVWKDLLEFFEKNCNLNEVKKLKDRYDMAVTPPHFLANVLDPKHNGSRLSEEESDSALQYIYSYHPNIMAEIINYQAQCGPFKPYLFHPDTVKSISPMACWSALFKRNLISVDLNILTMQLFTAVCSSAGIERLFSSFGFIHSKSRNRLGVEKCSKLVTIFKHLNK